MPCCLFQGHGCTFIVIIAQPGVARLRSRCRMVCVGGGISGAAACGPDPKAWFGLRAGRGGGGNLLTLCTGLALVSVLWWTGTPRRLTRGRFHSGCACDRPTASHEAVWRGGSAGVGSAGVGSAGCSSNVSNVFCSSHCMQRPCCAV